MLHFRNIIAMLLCTLLLCSLCACTQSGSGDSPSLSGQNGNKNGGNAQSAPASSGAEVNHYSAVHTILTCYSEVQSACLLEESCYYITDALTDSGEVLPYQLLRANVKQGEGELLEQFYQESQRLLAENQEHFLHAEKVISGADHILAILAQCQSEDNLQNTYPRLLAVQPDGTILWNVKLAEDTQDFFPMEVVRDKEGYSYVRSFANDLIVIDANGTIVMEKASCCQHLTQLADGTPAILNLQELGNAWTVQTPDIASQTLQMLGTLPISQENGDEHALFFPGANGYDLFCAGGLSLYGLKLSTQTQPEDAAHLLSWLNCDVDAAGLLTLQAGQDKGFQLISWSVSQGAEYASLQWQDTDPNAEKITLTMACRELPSTVSAAVLKFNRQSNDCRVVIKDYGAAAIDGIDRLTVDLNAGNVPDLFCTEGIDVEDMISGGWLADLWPYIDEDEVLSRESLVQPLFNAMSAQGKLYTVTGGFTLKTTLALVPAAGAAPGWSIEQMQSAASSMPALESLGGGSYTRQEVLEDIISLYAQTYIDREAGMASFDSPEFLALLEYAASYPETAQQTDDNWMPEGRQLFYPVELYNLLGSRLFQLRLSGGSKTVWKGYPGLAGSGSAFCPETPLAMSAACENKQAAWRFLRSILLPENQGYVSAWGETPAGIVSMPSNQSVFEAMLREMASQPENLSYTYADSYGNSVEVKGWNASEKKAFQQLIQDTVVVWQPENAVSGILRDEIGRFFARQQSAQSAASAIQNRVQLYLDEQG